MRRGRGCPFSADAPAHGGHNRDNEYDKSDRI